MNTENPKPASQLASVFFGRSRTWESENGKSSRNSQPNTSRHASVDWKLKTVNWKPKTKPMPTSEIPPFHIAFPVDNLDAARQFYGGLLGCPEGRSSDHWIDFNLYGHQIVAHYQAPDPTAAAVHSNPVDGHDVPVPHFGVVLPWAQWEALADRLKDAKIEFVIEPYIRFQGQVGEQATMFFLDPAGNALEFKAFKDMSQLFAK